MRVFAVSDIHVEHAGNQAWLEQLSTQDFIEDVLILAGDVSHTLSGLEKAISSLASRFKHVCYVPGNHDIWISAQEAVPSSWHKLSQVMEVAAGSGAATKPMRVQDLYLVPLQGWYDYSFGQPSSHLRLTWADYRGCQWPQGMQMQDVADQLLAANADIPAQPQGLTITFSHFLPRLDVMPAGVPEIHRRIYPVLGSSRIEKELRRLNAGIHVYGHSHINRDLSLEGVRYVNNALGYPGEERFVRRELLCIHSGERLSGGE